MFNAYTRIAQWFCVGLAMLAGESSLAQPAAYPNKSVRIIIPFAPGSASTPTVALYADKFGKEMGQVFISDHRPGGDTIVGTEAAAKANGDGYTLLAVSSAILVNHWLRKDLSYNALRDLAPISTLSRSDSALAIHPSVPANDLKEFIAYAKANPGKLNMISTAPAAYLHYQRLTNLTGAKFTIVNYKGGGPAMTDLLSGNVQGFITNISQLQGFIRAGKLRGLGVGGDKRSSAAPEVPTFAEGGLKDYDPGNWLALFAPIKTPRNIIEKLNAEVRKAQESSDVSGALVKQGVTPRYMTVAQAESFFRTEAERFGKLIKDSGLKAGDY